MKKYEYAHRDVFCKTSEEVDKVLNEEVYKLNKPEDIMSIQVIPQVFPDRTKGYLIPCCWYISYIYRWEVEE